MSESSLSNGAPSAAIVERALRNAVRNVYRSGDLDNLTIKRIRKSVEVDLHLQDEFFKNDPSWKEKSKNVIQSEVDSQADTNANGWKSSSIPSPSRPSKNKDAHPSISMPQKTKCGFRGTKRLSSDKVGPNKRLRNDTPESKNSTSENEEVPNKKAAPKPKKRTSSKRTEPKERQQTRSSDFNDFSGEEARAVKKTVSRARKNTSPSPESGDREEAGRLSEANACSETNEEKIEASESEMSVVLEEASKKKGRKPDANSAKPRAKANGAKADAADSEMSEVSDEAPNARGRKRKSDPAKPRVKKAATLKNSKTSGQSTDPDAEEIKRLQGWLIKCGIRKMWHRELAPYENSKAKIRHLKEILADAGMTGRYSVEKANQIKEERELQADLEAVQEGAKQWGKAETDGEDDTVGRPKRRLAKGLQELNFLNDDGEETD